MPGVELDGLRIRPDAQGEGEPLLIIAGRLAAAVTRRLFRTKDLVPRHREAAFPNRVVGEHGKNLRRAIRGLLRE